MELLAGHNLAGLTAELSDTKNMKLSVADVIGSLSPMCDAIVNRLSIDTVSAENWTTAERDEPAVDTESASPDSTVDADIELPPVHAN